MTKKKISEKELDMIENISKESLFKKKRKLTKAKEGKMLVGNQKKLDKNKDGKISGEDFKMMQAKSGKMMKAYKGDMAKGYGAARTQGQGLQDENLIPGKSLDYYKDIM